MESGSPAFMPVITGKEYLCLPPGRKFHQIAAGVDERDVRADAGEGHWRALVNLDAQAVRNKAHHAGRLDPRNLLELLFATGERNEEDIAADVAAHHFHDLSVRDVLRRRRPQSDRWNRCENARNVFRSRRDRRRKRRETPE